MNQWKKAGIVCCSDPLPDSFFSQAESLCTVLASLGIMTVLSDAVFASDLHGKNAMKAKADALMQMAEDAEISMIFDISGGDFANGVLPYLDFSVFAEHPKPIFGYSDLTVLLNAVYQKAGTASVLYSVRQLTGKHAEVQTDRFLQFLQGNGTPLFSPEWTFVQGEWMSGILIGGNIRCLLKLAGTPYFPECGGAVLFLESRSGGEGRIRAYFNQLLCMGVFSKISGVLLGTFTELEAVYGENAPQKLLLEILQNHQIPIAKTKMVGHGSDSCALPIGIPVSMHAQKASYLRFAHHADYDIISL